MDKFSRTVEPFKLLGDPATWQAFGTGMHDEATDAERRATRDFFLRRLAKKTRHKDDDRIGHIVGGSSCAFADLFVSACGGVEGIPEDGFDRFIAIMTFAWYQSVNHFNEGGAQ